ncbi:MAG: 50S ribosomal protein L6 [Minisyncoccia bacterium]
MSRIGKKPVAIPAKTSVTVVGKKVSVKGPLGELTREFRPEVKIEVVGNEVVLTINKVTQENKVLWGTYASHIKNMIEGVNKNYEKKLVIEGIGFKADVKGEDLTMSLGFSHLVKMKVPKGIKITSEKGVLTIAGMDKEMVGSFAAQIRSTKKPEPYKGKGIHYEDEVIRRKEGKKTA